MSLPEIESGLGLADTRSRTAPDRHRTLRAAIDWSYRLLSPGEQAMFRGLSVFAVAFRRDAAQAVTGGSADLLVRLADQSLLTVEVSPGGTRYRMLELIREYAAEKLPPAQAGQLRRRHAEWYAALAETANRERFDAAWLPRLTREIPDLRSAVGWCLGPGEDVECAVRITASLWWFWYDHGLGVEAWDWLRRALPAVASMPQPLRAQAFRAASALARANRDDGRARSLGEQALLTYRQLDDPLGVVSALNGLAFTALAQADHEAALAYAAECRDLSEAMGDAMRTAAAFNPLGMALLACHRHTEARAAFTAAAERAHAAGHGSAEAFALSNLAGMAKADGEPAAARELYVRSLRLYRRLDLVTGQLDVLDGLAGVLLAEGRAADARRLLSVADRERDRLDARPFSVDRESDREVLRARLGAPVAPDAGEPLDKVVDELL